VSEQTWEDTFRLSLLVQGRSSVTPGETLPIRVRLENISSEPAKYTVWSDGDPSTYVWLVPPYTGLIPIVEPPSESDPGFIMPVVTVETLAPGQVIERELAWDVKLQIGDAVFPAPNDVYTLRVDFFPGENVADPSQPPVSLSHQVTVTGGVELVPPAVAEQTARDLQAVQWWLAAHRGESIAREEEGVYSVNTDGVWEEASREAYEEALATNTGPFRSFSADTWAVTFSSKYGFGPHIITVEIDNRTGEVLSVTPDPEEELAESVVATFEVSGETFKVVVNDQETIDELFRLQRGESSANIPSGLLRRGQGPGLQNAPWSWHLQDLQMAEIAIEVCDGRPSMVEDDLDYWMGAVQRFCPWGATLTGIEDYRD
jgi:hypothetical protein